MTGLGQMLRAYWVRVALIILLTGLSALVLPGLRIESDLSVALHRSEQDQAGLGAETLAQLQARPVVLHVSSGGLTSEAGLNALSDLVLDLQLRDGVDQVLSVFALSDGTMQDSVLELALDQGLSPADALRRVRTEALAGHRFLGEELRSTIVVVQGQATALEAIPAAFVDCSEAEGFCVRAMGPIAIEQAIEEQLRADNLVLIPLTSLFCLGLLVVWFRNLLLAMLLMVPPGLGVIWYFGAMSALGLPLDAFNALVPTVILTLGLADMLHLYRAAPTAAGQTRGKSALWAVLPAITVTTVTTALAFASLALEGSLGLTRLALCGGLGVMMLWGAVVICGPLICHVPFARQYLAMRRRRTAWLLAITRRMRRRRAMVLSLAVGGALVGAGVMIGTPPDFEFEENLPSGPVAEAYQNAAEAGLALAPIFLTLPDRTPQEMQAALSALYPDIEVSEAQVAQTFPSQETSALPLIVPAGLPGSEILQLVDDAMARLPDTEGVGAVGFPLLASESILNAISRLGVILIIGVVMQAVILGVLLRSARVGFATLLPNLLPLLAIQIAMVLGVGWVNMSAAVAMIVASGIVVDDTAHLLWASRRKGGGIDLAQGLAKVAEPVTLTSLVLGCGFAISLFSGLPGLGIFGALMALAMCVAWLADMVVLPLMLGSGKGKR